MELLAELPDRLLTGLALDPHDNVFAICACSGELFRLQKESNSMLPIMSTEASPHDIAIDSHTGDVYITDRTESAILKLELSNTDSVNAKEGDVWGEEEREENGIAYTIVRYLNSFEGKPFIGPTALAFAPDGELFFTDAGAEGESSFADPLGAVYRTVQGRSQVVPLCARGLIRPSSIAIAPDNNVYVCEQGTNRVLRFVRRGTYYVGNVFAQLQGGMGPTAIAVSPRDNTVFVAQYDTGIVADAAVAAAVNGGTETEKGLITVFGRDGELKGVVRTPSTCLRAIKLDARGETLYALEADESTGRSKLYMFQLPSVMHQEE